MTKEQFRPDDAFFELLEAALEQRLTDDQASELERILLLHEDARQLFIEYTHQAASLHWKSGGESYAPPDSRNVADSESAPAPTPFSTDEDSVTSYRTLWGSAKTWLVGSVVAVLLITAVLRTSRQQHSADDTVRPFAVLASAKGCRWDGCTLPTVEGSQLGTGRLRLSEGLVQLSFTNGAELTLQGPADLELVSAKRCVMHHGMAVGHMPETAHGFTVETPLATLVDQGTDFGVSVNSAGETEVEVFEGEVDVRHDKSGSQRTLKTGQRSRLEQTSFVDTAASWQEHTTRLNHTRSRSAINDHHQLHTITTATGRGRDGYVVSGINKKNLNDGIILVKRSMADKHHRVAYLGFDLSDVPQEHIISAELTLTILPSGFGFGADLPDAVFSIYGITNDDLDSWTEQTLGWDNAPAINNVADILTEDVRHLGTFTVPQGVSSGHVTLQTPELTVFLENEANQFATLMLVRETKSTPLGSLVHAFASRRHPTAAPPTLRLIRKSPGRVVPADHGVGERQDVGR